MPEEKKTEETTATPPSEWKAGSTWWEDQELAPVFSRWIDSRGRLFIIVRAIYSFVSPESTDVAGCREIHLLNVEKEETQVLPFSEFKDFVTTKKLLRKR